MRPAELLPEEAKNIILQKRPDSYDLEGGEGRKTKKNPQQPNTPQTLNFMKVGSE